MLALLLVGVTAAAPLAAPATPDARPVHARGQTDFTAYTLEWGEVRLGLRSSGVGVLPRTQVTTQPLLDVLGAPNASLKVNALRAGPLDVSATADWGLSQSEALHASYVGAGATVSLQLARPWSVHGGASWVSAASKGRLELDTFAMILGQASGTRASTVAVETAAPSLVLDGDLRAVTAHAATDVRLNGRDSIVLQGRAVLWSDIDVPTFSGPVAPGREGWMPLDSAYAVSLAWQLSWRDVDVRVGAGFSSVPGAWLLNTVDLAYRFGGPTRTAERRAIVAWRKDARQRARDAREARVASNGPEAGRVGTAGLAGAVAGGPW